MSATKLSPLFGACVLGSLCLMSCQNQQEYEFTKGEPDFSSKAASNVMRIGAWVAPPPANWAGKGNANFITQESYDTVAESGINVIYSLYENGNRSAAALAAQYAERAGIKYLARDPNVSVDPEAMELEPGEMHASTSSYDGEKGLAGWLIQDEPSAASFPMLGRLKRYFEREYPGKEFYINLFPTYANTSQLGTSNYEDYIDSYISTVNPDFLSYDHYTMMVDGYGNYKMTEDVLWNLELVAYKCKEAGIPMYTFVQAMSYDGNTRVPNEAEIRHQVLTQMAYGSRSIQYFCYWTPLEFTQGSPSMITVDGQKTDIYYHVQKVNRELMNIDEAYLDFTWEDTMTVVGSEVRDVVKQFDMIEHPVTSLDGIASINATQNTLVGHFKNKDGVDAYLFTNFSDPKKEAIDDVEISLPGASDALIYQQEGKEVKQLSKGKLTLKLNPGDGAFIIPFSK